MRQSIRLAQAVRAEMRERGMVARLVMLNRRRVGEAYLCQFPDEECSAPRTMGTHFCADHITEMRRRACIEIRAEYEQDANAGRELAPDVEWEEAI